MTHTLILRELWQFKQIVLFLQTESIVKLIYWTGQLESIVQLFFVVLYSCLKEIIRDAKALLIYILCQKFQ